MCGVKFEVEATTQFGQTVLVVGEPEELGGWDPRKGLRLETSKTEYPIWRNTERLTFPASKNAIG